LAVTTPARAADGAPCAGAVSQPWAKAPVQLCPLGAPEANGWVPVYRHPVHKRRSQPLPAPAGWLHGTENQYFYCQQRVRSARFWHPRGWRNDWWAMTQPDSGSGRWVSQTYFRGGANDERDGGLRRCGMPPRRGREGASPGAARPRKRTRCLWSSRFYPADSWFNARLAHITYEFKLCPARSIRRWTARLAYARTNSTGDNFGFELDGSPTIRRVWTGRRNVHFRGLIPWRACAPKTGVGCRKAAAVIRFTAGPRDNPRIHVDRVTVVPEGADSDFEVFRTP